MKCLVVDDSATMRRIVVNALKSIGYDDVAEAGDGSDALQKCDASVELVITDWNMPVMGGIDFIRVLRSDPVHARTVVIMVTSENDPKAMARALMAGADEYAMKPLTEELLASRLDLAGVQLERPVA